MKRTYRFTDQEGNRITEFQTREKFTHLRPGYDLRLETDDYRPGPGQFLHIEDVSREVTIARGKFQQDIIVIECSIWQRTEQAAAGPAAPNRAAPAEQIPLNPAPPEVIARVRSRRRARRHDPLIDGPNRDLDI